MEHKLIALILCIALLLIVVGAVFVKVQVDTVGKPYFSDGFESGTFNAWTGTETLNGGSLKVLPSAAYSGHYGAEASSTGRSNVVAETYERINATALYERAYFRMNTVLPTGSQNLNVLEFINGANFNTISAVFFDTTGGVPKIELQIVYDGNYDYFAYNYNYTLNTWYCLELYLNDSTFGAATVWLNGNSIISVKGINDTGQGTIGQCEVGIAYSSIMTPFTMDYDNAVISNTYIGST